MASILNFTYCLAIEKKSQGTENSESINAISILTQLSPETIPGMFSFAIAFSLLDLDLIKKNTIRICFSKDDHTTPIVDSGEVNLDAINAKPNSDIPSKYSGLNICMDLRNVIFESAGEYITQIYLNGELIESKAIYVKGKR